jgi:hypothetical protein
VPGLDPRPQGPIPTEKQRVEALVALGLPRRAGIAEIRESYIRLARELHPDATGGDEERAARFRDVSAAYELLRRYHRHLGPAGSVKRDPAEYDPLWWKLFGEKV